jgi:thiamine-phosphate diphosphorylase/hydroxyethylthiazole kinase
MTGVIDYVSDGKRVIALENGHELMASITGSGCMATTVVGCFTAGKCDVHMSLVVPKFGTDQPPSVENTDILLATVAA